MLTLAGSFAVIGCNFKSNSTDQTAPKVTPGDVRRDVDQAAKTASELARQSQEEFTEKLAARLKELDAEIAKLRERGGELKDEAKANWEKKMAELEKKRESASAKLSEVRESSADAWKDIQKGAQSAWDDLDKAFQDAARGF
jgi:chromosome segregation ATPase